VGRGALGQVFQLSTYGTLAGLVAAVGFGLGTVTDGLQRLEVLLKPIYEALQERDQQGDLHQADETRWPVFVILEGKEGYGWWLWVSLSHDTVVYLLDPSRSHTVPENHYQVDSRGVLA
jgi:transposase